jgi:hypothetical protein
MVNKNSNEKETKLPTNYLFYPYERKNGRLGERKSIT